MAINCHPEINFQAPTTAISGRVRRWRYPRGRIIIFAREPLPGQCKTRLIPAIGPIAAARLQAQMISHALHQAAASNLCPVELWRAPPSVGDFFLHCRRQYGITLQHQRGADLGWRMHNAINSRQSGCRAAWALLIGSDCPFIDSDYLQKAALQLAAGTDAVLGPAEDGGYVLIGLQRTHPAVFANLPWGSNRVLSITRRRISHLGWHMALLTPLPDIDLPEDLLKLKLSPSTALRLNN
jgi:rSAM/selenodomain-associated transferase 1